MAAPPHLSARRERGAALVIVLAFVVLLTGLMVAYLSRTTSDRQVAQASFTQTKADQVAASGMDLVIGGLRQEITGPNPTPPPPYVPATGAGMPPVTFGNPDPTGIPNLVRRSVSGDTSTIPAPAVASFASALNSAPLDPANPKRGDVTLPRWNKHYLVPKKTTGDDSTDPVATFVAPDWVILTRNGPVAFPGWDSTLANPTPTNNSYAVGRYAYAVYDEGQLLDANVVGSPSGSTPAQVGRKGPVAYADLTQLPNPIPNGVGGSAHQVDWLVGWRNYGTTQPTNNFPASTFAANLQTAGTILGNSTAPADLYWKAILNRTAGFTTTSGAVAANLRTDQMFLSRQQLIAYRATTQFSSNALQYLTTFSRELNAPSWKPATPTAINPDLLNVLVTTAFTRFDGTSAAVGDLLIKQRFPLSRLAWITYKGPSATLQIGKDVDPTLKNPATSDPIILALVANGVSLSTIRAGTAANVKTCFGLVWDSRAVTLTQGGQWVYTSPNSGNSGGTFSGTSGTAATVVKTLTTVQSEAREPDFFELLKAAMLNLSLGLGSGPGDTFVTHEGRYYDTTGGLSANNQTIQIGANIIDQADPDSIPTLISFATNAYATAGIENLPYLNKLVFKPYWTGPVGGKYHFDGWLLPSLWNPHQNAPSASQNIQIAMTAGQRGAATETPAVTVTPITGGTSDFMTVNANLWGTVANPSANNPSAPTTTPSAKAADITKSPDGYWGFHVNSVAASDPTTAPSGTAYPTFPTACDFQLLVDVTGSGNWKPYQTWKGCSNSIPLKCPAPASWVNNTTLQDPEFVTLDPRTLRFGVWANVGNQTTPAGTIYNPVLTTLDLSVGSPPATGVYQTVTALPPQGTGFASSTSPNLYLYANNADSTVLYKDLDLVQRKGDLLTSSSYTTAMQPADWGDRPQILNRPFQSLAELGQVFRDQPWKTLDFTTAASPDVGLLDVFTLHDSANEAGKTSLNTRYQPMLTAILANAIKRLGGTGADVITSPQWIPIVQAIFNITSANPMIRKTDLLAQLANDPSVTGLGNKEARELVMRAFSDATQTRTWNLLIDVIAQSGRYPANASSLAGFLVEGEQHYWVHVAIDRFTGQVVDKQIEVVNE